MQRAGVRPPLPPALAPRCRRAPHIAPFRTLKRVRNAATSGAQPEEGSAGGSGAVGDADGVDVVPTVQDLQQRLTAAEEALRVRSRGGWGAEGLGCGAPAHTAATGGAATAAHSAAQPPRGPSPRLPAAAAAEQEEKERNAALKPFVVAAPKRGIIGNSRYAVALRREIVAASRDKGRCAHGHS